MDYLNIFEETKTRLLNVKSKITKEETELILTKEELSYHEDINGLKISNELFKFYNNLNGLEFEWNIKTDALSFSGFINIHSFEEMIENKTENKLWVDWYEEEDIIEIQKHRIFETLVGTDYYITIKLNERGGYKLYYVPEGSVNHGGSKKLREIPLKIDQYFKVINAYFGIHIIRHHLHEEKFYIHPYDVVPKIRQLVKIFPDFEPPIISL